MKSRFFLLMFFVIVNSFAVAQNIKGKVIDHREVGLQDVHILNLSNKLHTHSLEGGLFQLLSVKPGDTIRFSHLGFESYDYILKSEDLDSNIKIELKEDEIELTQVVVSNQLKTLNTLSNINLALNPVNNAQFLLRNLPGLVIGQHAGGGKAEQIFLRGFDIDHGTDINISVEGMPVNMVSHAHGQGYADLHFVIPETIERIDFDKGPYNASKGNFATAGYVNFQLKESLENNYLGVEIGQFGTRRTLAMIDITGDNSNHKGYIAGAFTRSDGPFESTQNFNRLNFIGRYSVNINTTDKISILASHFRSRWDASGQIPERAVYRGLISRFGAIDDTEGGQTSRTNFMVQHQKYLNEHTSLNSRFFYSKYDFELYSNFTFYLNNPELGDQIRQYEDRSLFGMESVLKRQFYLNGFDLFLKSGIGLRHDQVNDNELSRTANRSRTLDHLALGNVLESNYYGFMSAEFDFGKWLIQPGFRIDFFDFSYTDDLDSLYAVQSVNKLFGSPKLNISFNPNKEWQFFVKTGMGFHSNDSRVVVAQNGNKILPGALGIDVGTVWKPSERILINATLWHLFLEQEFVYVGDEAIIEPSGRTRRKGVEMGLRYQPFSWLYLNGDVNYTYARSIDDPEGANLIPLAPDLTSSGGVNLVFPSGFSGGFRYRFINDRPANEDFSIKAKGYFITDLNLNYSFKNVVLGLEIQNLFNTDWNETQFATESKLFGELDAVEEIHFTPGTPFFAQFKMGVKF